MLGGIAIGSIAGILIGMWLGQHPDDARAYGSALVARVKKLFSKTS